MSYSQFTLETVERVLGLSIVEKLGLFAAVPEVTISDFLGINGLLRFYY